MVDGGCIMAAHASPILVTPEVGLLTAWHWDLVPELCAQPLKGSGLGHGQCDLHPLHQGLDVLIVLIAEVARFEDRLVVRIGTSQTDSSAGLWSQKHGDHRPGVPGQR